MILRVHRKIFEITAFPNSFGTLRSAISAKVALGELLRFCPGSAGLSTSVEKAKTDCHDKARDWSLFERSFRVLKDLHRFERSSG